jgi:F-type H+-transporting ATPase subunit delta
MKLSKETRRLAKELLRNSFVDGELDRSRVATLVTMLIENKPRDYIKLLETYHRLVRLEVEKRTAIIETASDLAPGTGDQIVANLKRKYGQDLTAQFVVNRDLLGGMRIRVGSDVWDSSVRNRLHRLQQQL